MITDPRRALFSLLVMGGLLAFPAGAAAHEELREATPGDGEELAVAPDRLRLTFVNPLELGLAHLTLLGPDGAVALGELRRAADAPHVLVAPIRGRVVAGTYTVRWQVAGPDGHPVRGEYAFTILPDAEGLAPAPDDPAVGEPGPAEATSDDGGAGAAVMDASVSDFDSASPLYVAVRWLTFAGLLGVIGVVAFRLFVLKLLSRLPSRAALVAGASARARWIGLGAVAVLAVALFLRLYAQMYALHGPPQRLEMAPLRVLLGSTTWGLGWLLQAGGIVVAATGLGLAARRARMGWALAALGALGLAFTPALSGHAAGVQDVMALAVLADGLHVLGAGGWLGGLLAVVIGGLPVALRQPDDRGAAAAALIEAFSPTALFFAGLVVATGVFSAWLHVGEVTALWTTGYGRTLLVKVGVLSLVFGTGAYNWLRVKPTLGSPAAAGRLRRSATVELAIAVLVLAVTAVLVATPLPTEAMTP